MTLEKIRVKESLLTQEIKDLIDLAILTNL